LQRRILALLEAAPEHSINREQLDRVLVDAEGFDQANVLRAIKGLARKRLVGFTDRHQKKTSTVFLPQLVRHFTDAELSDLLAKIQGRG
jgi:hypothetical protein